jgi:hypothetical protein
MIEQVFALGDDALNNEATISITPLAFFDVQDPLRLRTTTFSIPAFEIGSYEVRYKTQAFEKPNGNVSGAKELSFSFRADKYWTIYQALLVWKNYIGDDRSGAMAEDVGAISGSSNIRTNVTVVTKDSNDVLTSPGWTFEQCWLKSLGGVDFDNTAEGDPIIVDVILSSLKVVPGI